MKQLILSIDDLVVDIINNYNNNNSKLIHKDLLAKSIVTTLKGLFGTEKENLATKLVESIATLTVNDLDVGDAYYTKTDGEPTLKKFMVNEARLRQANESRGRMKNEIDNLLLELVGSPTVKEPNVRVTNIDSFSAYIDRLSTERIKEYNFKYKQDKFNEAKHQVKVVNVILNKITKLFIEIFSQEGYSYIGEKRTFDEKKLIQDVTQVLKDFKND